ncbi:MAG: CDP-alcohol phosphatidyltransferase family protein [Desulfobacteraceae bacterium]|nr:CDP-alcohol phosphatidyltransferase family protein [Desulfobacteraceae bacterium]
MNVPNFITMLRILMVPLVVIFLMEGKTQAAFLVFVLAGISDGLDGSIARAFKQKTVLGAYLDPIADKLLLNSSFVGLAIFGMLPGWLAVLVVSRDIIILGGIGILLISGKELAIRPSLYSKVTTLVQLGTICLFLGQGYLGNHLFFQIYLVYLTSFFTVLSGLHYIAAGFRILGCPCRIDDHN